MVPPDRLNPGLFLIRYPTSIEVRVDNTVPIQDTLNYEGRRARNLNRELLV